MNNPKKEIEKAEDELKKIEDEIDEKEEEYEEALNKLNDTEKANDLNNEIESLQSNADNKTAKINSLNLNYQLDK